MISNIKLYTSLNLSKKLDLFRIDAACNEIIEGIFWESIELF